MLRLKHVCLLLTIALGIPNAFSKSFTNQFVQFELPTGWQCAIEGSEWVCQSENQDRRKEAIIILAAKYRGPQDSLEEYQSYLKGTKTYQLPGGKMQRSEPKYAKMKSVNNHQWVDALHLASEVPGFYTRYLATVKEDLGVAVTFSVTKDLYSAYQGIFDNVVASMRVFRQKKQNLADIKLQGSKGAGEANFDDTTFAPADQNFDIGVAKKKRRSSEGGDENGMLYLLGAVAVGGFLLMKLKKDGKGKKKKTKKKK